MWWNHHLPSAEQIKWTWVTQCCSLSRNTHTRGVTSLMFPLWPIDLSLPLNGLPGLPMLPPGPAEWHCDEALFYRPSASWFYIQPPKGRQAALPGEAMAWLWVYKVSQGLPHVREISPRCLHELSWIWEWFVDGASPPGCLQHWNLCYCFQLFLNDICFKNSHIQDTKIIHDSSGTIKKYEN